MYVAPPSEERFNVMVDSTKPSSLEDMRRIYPGHQDGRGHLDALPAFHLDVSLQSVRPVTGEVECVIKRFGGIETTVDKASARAWAKENGYRYPFPWERDAFFKAYPQAPGQIDRIVDLGSILDLPPINIPGYGEAHVCVRELSGHRGVRIFTNNHTEKSAGINCFLFIKNS